MVLLVATVVQVEESTKSELRLESYEGFTIRDLSVITGTRVGTYS
jgi:hypothetical protein